MEWYVSYSFSCFLYPILISETTNTSFGPAPKLQDANVPMLVQSLYDPKLICAGTRNTRVDHGDSGGPLFYKKDENDLYQVGVTSTGGNYSGADAENAGKAFNYFLIENCALFQNLVFLLVFHLIVIGFTKKPNKKSAVFLLLSIDQLKNQFQLLLQNQFQMQTPTFPQNPCLKLK